MQQLGHPAAKILEAARRGDLNELERLLVDEGRDLDTLVDVWAVLLAFGLLCGIRQ